MGRCVRIDCSNTFF